MKKKVRIIAGPNGSGKTTIYNILREDLNLNFGFFINADLIEATLKKTGEFNYSRYKIELSTKELRKALKNSGLNKHFDLTEPASHLSIKENRIISTAKDKINSYVAAAIADFLRVESMNSEIYFSYETVFSDETKIDFIKKLNKKNYDVYFYAVSTMNSAINKDRVKQRVKGDGHPVPEEKIAFLNKTYQPDWAKKLLPH